MVRQDVAVATQCLQRNKKVAQHLRVVNIGHLVAELPINLSENRTTQAIGTGAEIEQ